MVFLVCVWVSLDNGWRDQEKDGISRVCVWVSLAPAFEHFSRSGISRVCVGESVNDCRDCRQSEYFPCVCG